jgi:hypothetical protein
MMLTWLKKLMRRGGSIESCPKGFEVREVGTNGVELKMSRHPKPIPGTAEAVAVEILDNVLDLILNRHIHLLEHQGYLNSKKYRTGYGWIGLEPGEALELKWKLMDEAQDRFK